MLSHWVSHQERRQDKRLLRQRHDSSDACSRGWPPKLLLENGADIDARDKAGRALLHWAAHGGQQSVLELFLERGADARAKADNGETPPMVAAEYGDQDMLARLLALDPNIKPPQSVESTKTRFRAEQPNPAA